MKPTIFLMGPSDIEGQSITDIVSNEGGRIKGSANWSGVLPIQPFIWGDASLKAKSMIVLVGIQSLRVPEKGKHNLFNLVGDADASSTTLRKIQAMENEIQPIRCFNRPSDVVKTSRVRLPKTLADIPRCRLPLVTAGEPKSFSEVDAICRKFDKWPLIIRAIGYHAGEKMVVVENRQQLEAISDNPWLYDGILLIEFIDYRGEDQLYKKIRVIMVDGVPYPRHCIISNQRIIHAGNRSDLMDENDELCRQEEQFLAYLSDSGLKEYGDVFDAIYERIGLDIFGIDFSLVDGELVIFEANACMKFLEQKSGNDGRYRYLDDYVKALKRAIKKMLMTG